MAARVFTGIKNMKDYPEGWKPPQVDCSDRPSRTKQSFKASCDINTILNKALKTGAVPDAMYREGSYGDFTGIGDFQDNQLKLVRANESFMRLPSAIRKRFDNDPGKLIEFMADPDNLKEAQELGLAPKDPEPEKMPQKPAEPEPEPTPQAT